MENPGKSLCHLMPKIELHAHLNGSINIETLKELRRYNQEHGELQTDDEKWKQWENMFQKSEIPTLSECFKIFEVAHSVTVTPKAVQMATERVIQDFSEDNVMYLELRSTLRKETNMTKSQYLESMIAGVKNCQSNFTNITVKLIVSLNRKDSLQEAEENIDLAIKYSKAYPDVVAGIDLSGDPYQKKFSDYIHLLHRAREEGLKLTVHFAEIPGDEEISSILNFQPDRLGHGTCVHQNFKGSIDNWNLLLKSKIPVEICITSNVKCKTVPSVEGHHFQYFYNAGHPIVLCTDDKSVFQTSLSAEYETVKSTFGLSVLDLWKINYDAVNYTFADEKVKSRLREILSCWKSEYSR